MQGMPVQNLRLESRSNVFVMAVLYADTRIGTPVRVRNISSTGALIEGAVLPPVGTSVQLTRASLKASGSVIWLEQGKAGLVFETPVVVADWLPQGRRGVAQQFAEELFHQKRLGISGVRPAPAHKAEADLSDQLLELRQSLQRAAEALALDSLVAARHASALQSIDCIGQMLGQLASSANAANSPVAACRQRG